VSDQAEFSKDFPLPDINEETDETAYTLNAYFHVDEKIAEMKRYGFDPTNPADIKEWQAISKQVGSSKPVDYTEDYFEFGGPKPGQTE
jgi:hypothetical protein